MALILTTVLTFLLVVTALLCFMCFGAPVYQLSVDNVKTLLTLVVQRSATDSDWQVFLSVPIRHNDDLESVRLRCCEIHEQHYVGSGKVLLSDEGVAEVQLLLDSLLARMEE